MKNLFIILFCCVLSVNCKNEADQNVDTDQSKQTDSLAIKKEDINKINYVDIGLDVKTNKMMPTWQAYQTLADAVQSLKQADYSFFNSDIEVFTTAIKDLEDCETISLGGDDIPYWTEVFNNCGKNINIYEPEELIVAKTFRNAFLATKVSFFNQIFDYCQKTNVNFQKVSNEIGEDPRIGHSHTTVTKERGFGGHCFPKDTNAILKSANNVGVDLNIIRSAVEYNNKIRKNT